LIVSRFDGGVAHYRSRGEPAVQTEVETPDRFLIGTPRDRCIARQPPVLDRSLRLAGFAEVVREKLRLFACDSGHVG
jgi:hypothetical protein